MVNSICFSIKDFLKFLRQIEKRRISRFLLETVLSLSYDVIELIVDCVDSPPSISLHLLNAVCIVYGGLIIFLLCIKETFKFFTSFFLNF